MIKMKSCIIICGGQSRRMGQDKGSMIIHDNPMIKHILTTLNNEIDEAIIVLNNQKRIDNYSKFISPHDYTYEIKITKDKIKNKGPLSGIQSGLENIKSQYAIVFPCDSPYITKNTINLLFSQIKNNIQAIVPYHDTNNKLKTSEPLHSIYNKNTLPIITELIEKDILDVKSLISKIETKYVLIDNKKILKKEFKNLNQPDDLEKFN